MSGTEHRQRRALGFFVAAAAVLVIAALTAQHELDTAKANNCQVSNAINVFLHSDAKLREDGSRLALRAAKLRAEMVRQERDPVAQVVIAADAKRYRVAAIESRNAAIRWREIASGLLTNCN